MSEQTLLLYEEKFPCWDEETAALAGEDAASLAELAEQGLLAEAGNGYVLTAREKKCASSSRASPSFPSPR